MRYTDEQRAEAIALYIEHGAAEAGRRTNIPARTIRRWAADQQLTAVKDKTLQEATAHLQVLQDKMRAELRIRLLETALDALDRTTQEHVDYRGKDAKPVTWEIAPSGDMKNYATTAAIMLDKFRLEMGESTGRLETMTPADVELARVAAEFARVAAQ